MGPIWYRPISLAWRRMSKITLYDDNNTPAEVEAGSSEYQEKIGAGWTTWKKPSAKKTSKKKDD